MADYFPRQEFQKAGLSEVAIRALERVARFVETQEALEAAQANLTAQGDAIDSANVSIQAANDAINALDTRIDTLEAAGPYVEQDTEAAPVYAGQTITDPPTAAEVQAINDALVSLISKLQAAEVLS